MPDDSAADTAERYIPPSMEPDALVRWNKSLEIWGEAERAALMAIQDAWCDGAIAQRDRSDAALREARAEIERLCEELISAQAGYAQLAEMVSADPKFRELVASVADAALAPDDNAADAEQLMREAAEIASVVEQNWRMNQPDVPIQQNHRDIFSMVEQAVMNALSRKDAALREARAERDRQFGLYCEEKVSCQARENQVREARAEIERLKRVGARIAVDKALAKSEARKMARVVEAARAWYVAYCEYNEAADAETNAKLAETERLLRTVIVEHNAAPPARVPEEEITLDYRERSRLAFAATEGLPKRVVPPPDDGWLPIETAPKNTFYSFIWAWIRSANISLGSCYGLPHRIRLGGRKKSGMALGENNPLAPASPAARCSRLAAGRKKNERS